MVPNHATHHIYSCLSLFSISTEHPTNDQSFQNYQGEDEDPDASEAFMIYIYYDIYLLYCQKILRKKISQIRPFVKFS